MTNKPISAAGTRGFLIWTGDDYYFRVYEKDFTFKDYAIRHCDLEITITDADAFLYPRVLNSSFDGVLDHSPETLGLPS